MNHLKRIGVILLLLVPVLAWAYAPPTAYKKTSDRLFTNVGQQVELQARLIDGKPNPLFVRYRNASSRIWLKNGDTFEIYAKINGVLVNQVLASGKASCKATKRQPIYVRVRIEEEAPEPIEPILIGP